MKLRLANTKNSKLVQFCMTNPLAFHFFGYLFQKTPNEKSDVVFDSSDEVVGILANGRASGHFEFFSDWIASNSKEAVIHLTHRYLENLVNDKFPRGLWFDLANRDSIETVLGHFWNTTFDQLLILSPLQIKNQELPDGIEIVQLNADNFDRFVIHELVSPSLGHGNAIKKNGMKFMAAVQNNTVVGIAEASVRFCKIASVQHVFCIPDLRGKGIGSSIVENLCHEIFREGIELATYIAAETNLSSIRLAQKVGFELHTRLGFAELRN